tara:strand:+ start:570 stop:2204 length:1635 start_codon:yes stop_codon:yes gene_type:complete
MGITKLENQNLNDNVITSSKTSGTSVDSSKINAAITNDDISPSANISATKLDLSSVPSSQFVQANGSGGTINVQGMDEAIFNVGLLGFKMAVQEGLTIFNLVDGVVDEFNSEDGIDTAENSNAIYDATSDFYTNQQSGTYPGSPYIVSDFTSPGTYTAPATTTAINLLVVGGGGGGGDGHPSYSAGAGGAGGLIYLNNLPVTAGGTYSVTIGEGGEGKGYPGPGVADDGGDTTFVYSPSVNIIGEGGGGAGYTSGSQRPGGSGGGLSNQYTLTHTGGTGTQSTNHPVTGLSDFEGTPYPNSPPTFSAEGSEQVGSFGNPSAGPQVYGLGGGGAGSANFNWPNPQGFGAGASGGEALDYNILDGSTAVAFAGGGGAGYSYPAGAGEGGEGDEGGISGGEIGSKNAVANTGGGGGGGALSEGGDGADGRVVVATSRFLNSNASMTLISDTFTASSTPSKARLVVFAEIPDDLNTDINASVTRDNTTFNAVTLTDEGFQAGSSGIKIFSGSTPLTGSASPQVQLRWKIVGSSLTGANKIHGVSLQWA